MPVWAWVLAIDAGVLLLAAAGVWLLARSQPPERKSLAARIVHLPWRARAKLAWRLLRDGRVPLWLRAVVPALALYLAMPLDIIPDFIPVIGYLDDLLVIAFAAGILLRFTPSVVIEDHIAQLEGRRGGVGE